MIDSWSVQVGYKTRENLTILSLKQSFSLTLKVDLSNMQGYLFTKENPLKKGTLTVLGLVVIIPVFAVSVLLRNKCLLFSKNLKTRNQYFLQIYVAFL